MERRVALPVYLGVLGSRAAHGEPGGEVHGGGGLGISQGQGSQNSEQRIGEDSYTERALQTCQVLRSYLTEIRGTHLCKALPGSQGRNPLTEWA